MSDLVPDVCSNPAGCQCAICKLYPSPEQAPALDMAAYDLAVARRARAEDRLRAQRKRHAQREAALKAQLEVAELRLKDAMFCAKELLRLRASNSDVYVDCATLIIARALVAREKENKV